MFAFPEQQILSAHKRGKERSRRICVIGGGIAGLVAAYELTLADQDVHLLEASPRFGGRILTNRVGGLHGELGAMRIPKSHGCVWHYADDTFHLVTDPYPRFVENNPMGLYFLRGGPAVRRSEPYLLQPMYPTVPPDFFDLPNNHLADRLDLFLTSKGLDQTKRWDVFRDLPIELGVRQLDRLSTWQLFCMQEVGLIVSPQGAWSVFSQEEWEYLGRSSGVLWDEKGSALEYLVDEISFTDSKNYSPRVEWIS